MEIKRQYIEMALAGAGTLVLIGFILWLVAYQQSCRFTRDTTKDKQEISNTRQEINAIASNLDVDRSARDQKIGEIQEKTNELTNKLNADESARSETNAALANLANAVHSNGNVNAAVSDLEKKLDDLGIK